MRRAGLVALLFMGAGVCAAIPAYAAEVGGTAAKSVAPEKKAGTAPVYGWQLMSAEERTEYRNKMRAAKIWEEREKLHTEHHAAMQERAKEKGVTLPESPPARPRRGMGPGMGPGAGPKGPGPQTN